MEKTKEGDEYKQKGKVSKLSQRIQENKQRSKPVVKTEKGKLSFSEWAKIIVVNAVVTLGILFLYHTRLASPPISVVDLKGYLADLQGLYLQGKITQEEAKEKLDKAIEIIQKEAKSNVVLSSDVVFGKNSRVKKLELPELPKLSPSDLGLEHNESQHDRTEKGEGFQK